MAFSWLLGQWRAVGYIALSSALIYLSVVGLLRLGERRTLAEMTAYDFTVAIAIGGIIARTATTPAPSYVQGLTATVVLLGLHAVLSWWRLSWHRLRTLIDHAPVVLVRTGRIDHAALRATRLTIDDLNTAVRQHGLGRMSDAALVVLEPRGQLSVIRATEPLEPEIVPVTRAVGMRGRCLSNWPDG